MVRFSQADGERVRGRAFSDGAECNGWIERINPAPVENEMDPAELKIGDVWE